MKTDDIERHFLLIFKRRNKMPSKWEEILLEKINIERQYINEDGFACVNVVDEDGNYTMRRVDELVLEHYKGPAPEGMVAKHLDGRLANSHPDNLEWAAPDHISTHPLSYTLN
jgi:hypothetical protein